MFFLMQKHFIAGPDARSREVKDPYRNTACARPSPTRWGWVASCAASRTVPHLWAVAEDMARLCPDATLLQYVNPMAINTWALAERFPRI
jgi:hypothetical protein